MLCTPSYALRDLGMFHMCAERAPRNGDECCPTVKPKLADLNGAAPVERTLAQPKTSEAHFLAMARPERAYNALANSLAPDCIAKSRRPTQQVGPSCPMLASPRHIGH